MPFRPAMVIRPSSAMGMIQDAPRMGAAPSGKATVRNRLEGVPSGRLPPVDRLWVFPPVLEIGEGNKHAAASGSTVSRGIASAHTLSARWLGDP